MSIRFASPNEVAAWNESILRNPDGGNLFQGKEFADQKQGAGWNPKYIVCDTTAMTVLEKKIIGLGKFWYVPKGPGVTNTDELIEHTALLWEFAADNGVFVVKIEPELTRTDETKRLLSAEGMVSSRPVQPNFSTITIDLSPTIDEVLAGLNQKGRHAIKRAERDGVTVERVASTDENCQLFYSLLRGTAEGSFSIRSYDYYKSYWQRYTNAHLGQLFFAYVDGNVVAGAYAITYGHKSTYKDGASIKERTAYGASHLLQWNVMLWAKSEGSLVHDLCGSPPSDKIKDETHPHYGIGRFKTSFNKTVTDYIGAFDIPVNQAKYDFWAKIGERVVVSLHRRRHHENWY